MDQTAGTESSFVAGEENEEDFFAYFYSEGPWPSLLLGFAWISSTLVGLPLCLGIISYQSSGVPLSFTSVISSLNNGLYVMIVFYDCTGLAVLSARAFGFPLPPSLCHLQAVAMFCCGLNILLVHLEVTVLRYMYSSVWKNIGALNDDFMTRFLTALNLMFCILYGAILVITNNVYCFINAFCQGKDPVDFLHLRLMGESPLSFLHFAGFLNLLLSSVLSARSTCGNLMLARKANFVVMPAPHPPSEGRQQQQKQGTKRQQLRQNLHDHKQHKQQQQQQQRQQHQMKKQPQKQQQQQRQQRRQRQRQKGKLPKKTLQQQHPASTSSKWSKVNSVFLLNRLATFCLTGVFTLSIIPIGIVNARVEQGRLGELSPLFLTFAVVCFHLVGTLLLPVFVVCANARVRAHVRRVAGGAMNRMADRVPAVRACNVACSAAA